MFSCTIYIFCVSLYQIKKTTKILKRMKIIRLTDNSGETFFLNCKAVFNRINGKLIYNGYEVKTAENLAEILESASCSFDFIVKDDETPVHALMGIKPDEKKIILSYLGVID